MERILPPLCQPPRPQRVRPPGQQPLWPRVRRLRQQQVQFWPGQREPDADRRAADAGLPGRRVPRREGYAGADQN